MTIGMFIRLSSFAMKVVYTVCTVGMYPAKDKLSGHKINIF